ncbi:MAG TPA: hypothetical protein VKV02_15290 [Acidobacteriaceae bacterium]|nr:hypothetical protein [Acidobacteriaceae bacterium]
MPKSSGALALILLGATAVAQAPASASNAVVVAPPPSQNCPVGLQARHEDEGGMVKVSPAERHRGQGYRLTLAPEAAHRILKAKVTLHGIAGQQVVPAANGKPGDVTETVTLSPWIGQDHHFHSTVYTEKLTGVQWIELNALTYADGTEWQASPSATCRVAPNGYMLVAGK